MKTVMHFIWVRSRRENQMLRKVLTEELGFKTFIGDSNHNCVRIDMESKTFNGTSFYWLKSFSDFVRDTRDWYSRYYPEYINGSEVYYESSENFIQRHGKSQFPEDV